MFDCIRLEVEQTLASQNQKSVSTNYPFIYFLSIRKESEFQQIVRYVEDKYQAEHERVRKWLEENDML
jgi:hypothetical protein